MALLPAASRLGATTRAAFTDGWFTVTCRLVEADAAAADADDEKVHEDEEMWVKGW